MRIGIFASGDLGIDALVATAAEVEADGFDSFWLPQIFATDALCAHTVIGREVPRIELGTAVVPTYPRHPLALAQQALTASATSGGRFTLGIGLSHQLVIEGMYGQSYSRPVRHLDEYLSCLLPPLSLEPVDFEGETLTAKATLGVPGAHPVPVLVAALGPKMLDLAARRTAGTITWMTGPTTLKDHTVPTLTAAAAAADMPPPRVVAALPVAVTDDPDGVRAKAAKVFSVYGFLPSYRAMLDREGAAGPADVAVVGTAAEVRAGLERVAEAGVTDFVAVEFITDDPVRSATRDRLKELV